MMNDTQFLTEEESLAVEKALLTTPEKFLTRLTISSFKLLTIIAEDLDISLVDLTSEQIIQWMEKDSKIKREKGIDEAVLKW